MQKSVLLKNHVPESEDPDQQQDMVLILERDWSLTDIRKEQRRVTALILAESTIDLLKYPLRRRHLPHAYCYVCSRVDPGGIFRNPNSYLFKKGFFQSCEHFPKAPYTTFVADEKGVPPSSENRTCTECEATAPSISVTIKHSSDVASQLESATRDVKTPVGSSLDKNSLGKSSKSRDRSVLEKRKRTGSIPRLPSITTKSGRELSNVSSHKRSGVTKSLDREHSRLSIQSKTDNESIATNTTVTVIPYGQDDGLSDIQSRITGLSTLTKGSTPSKSSNDLDTKPRETANATSSYTARTDLSTVVDGDYSVPKFINESDGLEAVFDHEAVLRESGSLDSYRQRRPKAGKANDKRARQKMEETKYPARPGSGHLRYHHRLDEDSVPYPGFEIPPTPSDEELLSLTTSESERQEADRKFIERQIAEGNVFAASSVGFAESLASGEGSIRLAGSGFGGYSKSELITLSGHRSFCRCSTGVREQSVSAKACKTCGKPLRHGESTCSSVSSPIRSGVDRLPTTSQGSMLTKSRQKMLYESRKLKSKTITDEDYMDLESIIHEDDGHYFSSDDDEFPDHFDKSPETYDRFRKNRGGPKVNPDLHKIVYLRALREAQLRKFKRDYGDLSETDQINSRPPVFSYFELWPYADKRQGPIGLRPPESIKVKKGQFMKHIFGEVNIDDFYSKVPESTTQTGGNVQIGMPIGDSGKVRRMLPEIPREKDVSSVSLKMSRSELK